MVFWAWIVCEQMDGYRECDNLAAQRLEGWVSGSKYDTTATRCVGVVGKCAFH